jgi:ribosomal protein S18 acetylase RimI-like enzyme
MKSAKSSSIVFRRAVDGDVVAAAALMRAAFKMWEPIGYKTSSLTESMVRRFFLQDGYVAEDGKKRMVGVVCINYGTPALTGKEMRVARAHRTDTTVLLEPAKADYFAANRFAYLYSLAVDPACARKGIGRQFVRFVEKEARRRRCRGILLETGQKTGWLIEWYQGAGFRLIGESMRDGEPVVFMFKDLR